MWHLVDLPEGYHAVSGQAWQPRPVAGKNVCRCYRPIHTSPETTHSRSQTAYGRSLGSGSCPGGDSNGAADCPDRRFIGSGSVLRQVLTENRRAKDTRGAALPDSDQRTAKIAELADVLARADSANSQAHDFHSEIAKGPCGRLV